MRKIDPTARVEGGAVIDEGTAIGPYCLIGRNVVIGNNCKLIGHVTVMGHTSIGDNCVISPFVGLGGALRKEGHEFIHYFLFARSPSHAGLL